MNPGIETFFRTVLQLNDDDLARQLAEIASLVQVPKNTVFIHAGQTCEMISFLLNGVCMSCRPSPSGQPTPAMITWRSGEVVMPADLSVLKFTESPLDYTALVSTTLVQLPLMEGGRLLWSSPAGAQLCRGIAQNVMHKQAVLRNILYEKSARGRVDMLRRSFPDFPEQITDKVVASLLGISACTLSRIKTADAI